MAVTWAVWAPILFLAAALTGWAFSLYLRRTSPTEHIPAFRWRLTSGGVPGWALALGAGSSAVCLLAALKLADGRLVILCALFIAWVLVALLVQAALLTRHNQRLDLHR
jgi:hypothetical protein